MWTESNSTEVPAGTKCPFCRSGDYVSHAIGNDYLSDMLVYYWFELEAQFGIDHPQPIVEKLLSNDSATNGSEFLYEVIHSSVEDQSSRLEKLFERSRELARELQELPPSP